MKAWLLGSGGWIPTDERETTCVLLRQEERALVLDAGSGLRHVVTDSSFLDGVERLDIVLTHFHFDHVCGLAYLPALPVAPTVWGPGRWLHGVPTADAFGALREGPFMLPLEDEAIRELEPGAQRIGEFEIRTREQSRHAGSTAGLRIGDAVALITDTAYDPDSSAFAHRVDHLLHEAWSPSDDPILPEVHSTGAQAGQVARDAQAKRFTLTHLNPQLPDQEGLLRDARGEFPDTQLGQDCMAILD